MPNKVRIVVQIGGYWRLGKTAREYIEKTYYDNFFGQPAPKELKTNWEKLVWMFDKIPILRKNLYVIREPRRCNRAKSMYMAAAQYLGQGRQLPRRNRRREAEIPETLHDILARERPGNGAVARPARQNRLAFDAVFGNAPVQAVPGIAPVGPEIVGGIAIGTRVGDNVWRHDFFHPGRGVWAFDPVPRDAVGPGQAANPAPGPAQGIIDVVEEARQRQRLRAEQRARERVEFWEEPENA